MARKQSNLSVAADVDTVEEMLDLAEKVGPHIVVFKTHVDIFDKWDDSIVARLQEIAKKHGGLKKQWVKQAGFWLCLVCLLFVIVAWLQAIVMGHDFLIFEDRKFADIGNTVVSQYAGGIYKIAGASLANSSGRRQPLK
eukprot:1156272-Pelagomonas_calceolata.AAC.12